MTRVTVVSPFYNRGGVVDQSVDSLLAQTHADLQIIVADDGSKDDTYARLSRYSDPRLTVFTQPNAGLVATLNRMIGMATGEYIAIHGSGDISYPDRIARQAALLDSDPRIGLVGCRVRAGDRISEPHGWDVPGPHSLADVMLKPENRFTHGEMMFRKSLFDRVGGYRPAFRFAQDRDLWLRLGEHTDYGVVPDILYERFHLESGVSRSAEHVVLQKKLAFFAVQCAVARRSGRPDPIDRHGVHAFLLAERNPHAARQLLRLGLGFARRGDHDGARFMFEAAERESTGILRRVAYRLSRFGTSSAVWRFVPKGH